MSIPINDPGASAPALRDALFGAVFPQEAVTTGASPITVDYKQKVVLITTGGTGGVEIIKLTSPALDIGGVFTTTFLGGEVVFVVVAQTDPGDIVQVQLGDDPSLTSIYVAYGNQANQYQSINPAYVTLTSVGNIALLIWNGAKWLIDLAWSTLNSFPIVADNMLITSHSSDTGVAPGNIDIQPAAGVELTHPGGKLTLEGGQGFVDAAGGDLEIGGGNGNGNANGNLKFLRLPTADPLVVGVAWNNSGVLTISAG